MQTSAPKAAFHIPGLDGIRAVSIILVFISHAGLGRLVPGGFGVTIFFFLSGFLITTLMRREFDRTGGLNIKEFYFRRALRIFPPMYIVLALGTILSLLGLTGRALYLDGALASALHFTNYFVVFGPGERHLVPGLGVLWSLAVEEHFYLVFPFLFATLYPRLGHRRFAVLLAIIAALVLLWRIWLVYGAHVEHNRTYLATDTRIDSILFGSLLALWRNPALEPDRARFLATVPYAVGGLLLLVGSLAIRNEAFRETFRYSVQSFALIPLFCAAILRSDWKLVALLESPIAKWLGLISYTFYLVHLFALELFAQWLPPVVSALIALGFTLAVAQAMRILVEKPLAAIRKRHNPVPAA